MINGYEAKTHISIATITSLCPGGSMIECRTTECQTTECRTTQC
jgi:hypothetical protein